MDLKCNRFDSEAIQLATKIFRVQTQLLTTCRDWAQALTRFRDWEQPERTKCWSKMTFRVCKPPPQTPGKRIRELYAYARRFWINWQARCRSTWSIPVCDNKRKKWQKTTDTGAAMPKGAGEWLALSPSFVYSGIPGIDIQLWQTQILDTNSTHWRSSTKSYSYVTAVTPAVSFAIPDAGGIFRSKSCVRYDENEVLPSAYGQSPTDDSKGLSQTRQ